MIVRSVSSFRWKATPVQYLLAFVLAEGLSHQTHGYAYRRPSVPVQHLQQTLHPEELAQCPHAPAPRREVLRVLHLQEKVLPQDPVGAPHGPAQHRKRGLWGLRGQCRRERRRPRVHPCADGRPGAGSWSGGSGHACGRGRSRGRNRKHRSGRGRRSQLPGGDHLHVLRVPCQVWPNRALQWPHAQACLRRISTNEKKNLRKHEKNEMIKKNGTRFFFSYIGAWRVMSIDTGTLSFLEKKKKKRLIFFLSFFFVLAILKE